AWFRAAPLLDRIDLVSLQGCVIGTAGTFGDDGDSRPVPSWKENRRHIISWASRDWTGPEPLWGFRPARLAGWAGGLGPGRPFGQCGHRACVDIMGIDARFVEQGAANASRLGSDCDGRFLAESAHLLAALVAHQVG